MKLRARLTDLFVAAGPSVVALSGGVDSSVLAVLGTKVQDIIAVTGVSPSLSSVELGEIRQLCELYDIEHIEVKTDELSRAAYQKNDPDRCYYCKDTLYAALREVAASRGRSTIFDGTHQDDLGSHRPGARAAKAHLIRSPFVEVGAGKDDIRALARELGLANAERPAQPCLSSRVAYGVSITPERLRRVAEAEAHLRKLGLSLLRVRLHDAIARIEVHPRDFHRVVEHHHDIVAALREAGFVYVTLDLAGLRSGSLLEVLPS